MLMNRKLLCAVVACVLSVVLLVPFGAGAVNSGDGAVDPSLSITFAPDDLPAAGVNFSLYRVADLVGEGKYALTGQFANCPVSTDLQSAEDMRVLAMTLRAYVIAGKLTADMNGKTDANGIVGFSGLDTGLYLALGDVFLYNNQYYFPTPFLVKLPDADSDGVLQYAIQVSSKHTFRPGTGEKIGLEVMKVWDDGDSDARPQEITIELYEGKLLNDRVTLNQANNWRYSWDELDAGTVWSVVEVDVPDGYTVAIKQIDDTYIVTNTLIPDEPEDPSSSTPSEPQPSSRPTDSSGRDDTPSGSTSTTPSKPADKLPQTGMLWWPVFALTAGGLVLIIAGVIRRKGVGSGK